MARIFKQHYTESAPDGGRVTRRTRKWYVEYVDGDGVTRRVPGYVDKQATAQLASELERKAGQRKAGLIDRFDEHRKRPLREHLDDWQAALVAKGNTAKYANLVSGRARRVHSECGFIFWPDMSASKTQEYIAELRASGLGVQTCNFYLQAVKAFARWMQRDGRAGSNPLAYLQGGNARTDRRHDRRALSPDELRWLLNTTRDGPERFGLTGPDRTMLYGLAVTTGLRASEIGSLTPRCFDLDADPPTVTVEAAYSKHRRDDVLPLRADVVGALRTRFAGLAPNDPVFAMPDKPAKMIRADLDDARAAWIQDAETDDERRSRESSMFLAYRDGAGRVADFHSLRHTFITNLARGGVYPKTAQGLARHSTIMLKMDRYSHTVIGEQAAALDVLPDLDSTPEHRERQRATGTDGRSLPDSLPARRSVSVGVLSASDGEHAPHAKSGRSRNTVKIGKTDGSSRVLTTQTNQSHRGESNPRPAVYKTAALPTELRWQCVILGHYSLPDQHPPNRRHLLRHLASVSKPLR